MSFQDVGRGRGRGNAGKREKSSMVATNTTTSTGALGVSHISPKKTLVDLSASASSTAAIVVGSRTNIFGSVSDTILQYQRNVAILNNIAKSFLSTTNSEEEIRILSQQYEVQRDVISQLGSKIERQLREAEVEMSASSSLATTSEATQARNAHIKLTRDYRAVELVYKNLVLNVKQRKHFIESQKQLRMQQEQQVVEEQQSRQQMMLQVQRDEEQINLQIMREREEEIRKINQGMRTVNEIYKVSKNPGENHIHFKIVKQCYFFSCFLRIVPNAHLP